MSELTQKEVELFLQAQEKKDPYREDSIPIHFAMSLARDALRLQRAEELLRDLRGIVSTAESDGWHVDDIPERIDAFLGESQARQGGVIGDYYD